MRTLIAIVLAAGALVAAPLTAGPARAAETAAPPAAPSYVAPDYGQAASWLCRPGAEQNCTADFGALVVDAAGNRTPQPFQAIRDAPVDCFYVYPTISRDASTYSDMVPGPAEEIAVVRSHAGRFASRCRVFAPMYRSLTLQALSEVMKGAAKIDFDPPYEDVRAAWREYLANDNHGRGVILIGHSQGTILLQRLLAEEIDGKPAQKILVSAYLAGDPGFGVPAGKTVGGTLKSIPVCTKSAQVGCVVVWSSYADDDQSPMRFFGHNPAPGLVAACVNPAAPAGGGAMIKSYIRKPQGAPAEDPPYVEAVGQMSAQCVTDAQGSVLRVHVEPGKYAELLKLLLSKSSSYPGWGLHILDMPLTLGDQLDLASTQIAAWRAARP